jgi:hypothetical protein
VRCRDGLAWRGIHESVWMVSLIYLPSLPDLQVAVCHGTGTGVRAGCSES